MNTKIIDRSADLSASLREYMESKVVKLEKFFSRISDAQILITSHKNMYSVEITANANGVMLRGEDRSQDMRKSYDLALKNLEKQIKRRSSYLKDKAHYNNNNEIFSFNLEGDYEADDNHFDDLGVVRVKKIPVRPMETEEAIMQMDLLGHEFFMFLEALSGKMNVIYRRKDGGYGQIQPID
ncbi:MAG: ribosome-associated translation inhibitor RaiA [Synergistaceae bacterium]|nr:ribosome-associated translation inhibitor RaiA [Synergistaceae bacterium]